MSTEPEECPVCLRAASPSPPSGVGDEGYWKDTALSNARSAGAWEDAHRELLAAVMACCDPELKVCGLHPGPERLELEAVIERQHTYHGVNGPFVPAPPVGVEVVKLTPVEPIAWLHEIDEPVHGKQRLMSFSQSNPWSHWMQEHRDRCVYTVTALGPVSVPSSLLKEAEEALRRQGPRFKIRQLGEIDFDGFDGPEKINGLILEALTDDDVRAAGSLLGQVVTVGGAS